MAWDAEFEEKMREWNHELDMEDAKKLTAAMDGGGGDGGGSTRVRLTQLHLLFDTGFCCCSYRSVFAP